MNSIKVQKTNVWPDIIEELQKMVLENSFKLCDSVDIYLCARASKKNASLIQRMYWFTDITILAYTDENYFMVMTDNHKMSDIKILEYVVKVD